jgi:hypothetical protein
MTMVQLPLVALNEAAGRVVLELAGGRRITLRIGMVSFLENCRKYGRKTIGCNVSIIDEEWMEMDWAKVLKIYGRIAARYPLCTDHPRTYAEFAQLPYDLFDDAKEYCIYPTKAWQISGLNQRMWVFDDGARIHFNVGGDVPTLEGATRNIVV